MSSHDEGRYAGGRGSASAAAAATYDDPMARVLGLDSESTTARWFGYGLGAVALMLGLAVGARAIAIFVESTNARPARAITQEIDVQVETPPPPPPEPPKPEEKQEAPRPVAREAPPPPPAQAGKVLTREADPNEPVDLTGDTIVTGNAEGYVGGVTASNGTSKTAVREAAPTATQAPASAAPPAPDKSRQAKLAGGSDWDCPFPEEADALQIDDAHVTIQVEVRPDGSPANVTVSSDPGHGFARMARTCALGKHFEAAADRDGHPIDSTMTVRIHFTR
jgi:protein TonB